MRVLLDTSVLISGAELGDDWDIGISAASIAELHFGVAKADDEDERARRTQLLGAVEAAYEPLAIDARVAREWGRLAGVVARQGGRPRRRAMDLAIAATANVHEAKLLTHDVRDFDGLARAVEDGHLIASRAEPPTCGSRDRLTASSGSCPTRPSPRPPTLCWSHARE